MAWQLRNTPERIVCLTEEPTETLYLLGEARRIVGISAYTRRPPQAKRDKPVVSAFIGGSVSKIKALEPDLVIGFSDIQADLAKQLIAANLQVLIFNQRTLQEILDTMLMLGRLVGAEKRAETLVRSYIDRLSRAEDAARGLRRRPRVYFEEWDEPMISGIEWVSELITVAGGDNIFAENASGKLAKERFVRGEDVIARAPDIMFASWCGKPVDRTAIFARPGWQQVPALAKTEVHEVDSCIILQPGPACLTDGLDALADVIQRVGRSL